MMNKLLTYLLTSGWSPENAPRTTSASQGFARCSQKYIIYQNLKVKRFIIPKNLRNVLQGGTPRTLKGLETV